MPTVHTAGTAFSPSLYCWPYRSASPELREKRRRGPGVRSVPRPLSGPPSMGRDIFPLG